MNGNALFSQIEKLFPLMRSITGPGARASLRILQEIVPLQMRSVASGTRVLDWEVPDEWHFREAFIANAEGEHLIDASRCNLHVINFSQPIDRRLTFAELRPHLHCLPDNPTAVPYRTSYYTDDWGFCLSRESLERLGDGPFHVRIDAERVAGHLDWGELVIPGTSEAEILVSTHICHPSLANDNLSGMVLGAALAASRLQQANPHTWRFLFVPATIGAISWLATNRLAMPDIRAGLVITGLGDDSAFSWKSTRRGSHWIDRVVERVLAEKHPEAHRLLPFGPYGYDERQYTSPGFDLPVGRLTRAVHGTFPEYHTDGDNLDFIKPERLAESLELLEAVARLIDRDVVYENLSPFGEPQLGRRGLYGALGAQRDPDAVQMAMLWMLNQSDGSASLLDIAEHSGLTIDALNTAADLLVEHELLRPLRRGDEQTVGATTLSR